MTEPIFTIITLILGLGAGLALGWFLGGRPAADLRARLATAEAETKELDTRFRAAIKELGDASIERATLKANAANFDEQKAEQKALLLQSQESLEKVFEASGAKILAGAQEQFLQSANERFGYAEKANKQAIETLLQPVGDKLAAYEKSVREMEADRKKDIGSISSLMEQVRVGQEAVKIEAAGIVSSLRSGPKTSGRWGEQQFENLLDISGLSKFIDYRSEVSVRSDDGILRPDYVISLPGGRKLIVDIKCPLDAYLTATEEIDPSVRKKGFERYSSSVRGHAVALGRKGYWTQFDDSPEFVILYVPGDNFLSAALEHDKKLWEDSARKRVIISGPATFFPLARTIAAMWDQEKLADKAEEVLELGRSLHENLAIMSGRIKNLGKDLDKTVRTYNEFIASIDGKVILTARKFEQLSLTKTDKRIADLEPVDEQSRGLMRLANSSVEVDPQGSDL